MPTASSALKYSSLDLEWHHKEARMFWKLHYAQTAQDIFGDLLLSIQLLAPLQTRMQGTPKRTLTTLLTSYYRLAATIQRDRGHFQDAYHYANEGVRLARELGNDPATDQLIAASLYTKGVVNFAWGAFGTEVRKGRITLEQPPTGCATRFPLAF